MLLSAVDAAPLGQVVEGLGFVGGELQGSGQLVFSWVGASGGDTGAAGSSAASSLNGSRRVSSAPVDSSAPARSGPTLGSMRVRFGPRRESFEPKERLKTRLALDALDDRRRSAPRMGVDVLGRVVVGGASAGLPVARSKAASSAEHRSRSARRAESSDLLRRVMCSSLS